MEDTAKTEARWTDKWPVAYQLAREMGLPFLIAIGWTIFSVLAAPSKRNFVDAVSVFGGSFFLSCWAFSQWFRVKKQQAVESGLGGIVKKQEHLIETLMAATERLEGHASGGKSVAWLSLSPRNGIIQNITASVKGDYSVIDARASVLDLSKNQMAVEAFKLTGSVSDFFKYHVLFICGTLQPGVASLQKQALPYDINEHLLQYRVEWTARNGIWTQFIELKKDGDGYVFYTAIQRGGEWVFEKPERESIPKTSDGKPDVFWHSGAIDFINLTT
jgi:hypothetical protein